MSLSINIYPATMALVGNPIKLSLSSSSFVTYVISADGNDIYTGSGEGSFDVFIQDILANILSPDTLYNEYEKVLISVTGTTKDIVIKASNTEGNTASLSLKTVLGGISKRLLRRLNDEYSNIFTWKLLNSNGNFFQTTRSTSRIFSIKETELLPIPFLYPDEQLKVIAGGVETSLPGTTGKPYALNLYFLRKTLFEERKKLLSVFDIYSGGTKACTIVVSPGTISKERYLIEFLNSYGAYERIEVTGTGNFEQDNAEDTNYHIYDDSVDDYVESRERQARTDILKVESGYKSSDDINFMLDMLSSDDVKVLGFAGRSIKVNPDAENLVRAARASTPENIKLSLRLADSENHHSGSLNEEDFGSPRIHTVQFTQEFN